MRVIEFFRTVAGYVLDFVDWLALGYVALANSYPRTCVIGTFLAIAAAAWWL